MIDIVPTLLEEIKKDFNKRVRQDKRIKAFMKKIDKENAQGSDVSLYSEILGEHLSDALIKNITDDKLPEGKIYYNIAERIIMPMLEEVHKLVNISAVNVQKIEDKKGNIKIKPQQGAFPTERAKAIIQAIADTTEEMFDD